MTCRTKAEQTSSFGDDGVSDSEYPKDKEGHSLNKVEEGGSEDRKKDNKIDSPS